MSGKDSQAQDGICLWQRGIARGASNPFLEESPSPVLLSQATLSLPKWKRNHCSDFPEEWVVERRRAAPTPELQAQEWVAGLITAQPTSLTWLSAPYLESFRHPNQSFGAVVHFCLGKACIKTLLRAPVLAGLLEICAVTAYGPLERHVSCRGFMQIKCSVYRLRRCLRFSVFLNKVLIFYCFIYFFIKRCSVHTWFSSRKPT